MEYAYNYEIISVDETARCMEIIYTAPGRSPVHVGARLPIQGEDLMGIIHSYSPVERWREEAAVQVPPIVGTTGSYVPPGIGPVTLDSAKETKKDIIARWRYEKEISGVIINNTTFRSDRESQAQLLSAFSSLQAGLITSVDWKTVDGSFVTLGLTEVIMVAKAVAQHVQTSFTQEKDLCAQVDACSTIDQVESINLPQ